MSATDAEAPKKTTVTVTIDGKQIEAQPGELLIAAAERTGTFIPRFCWHPRMREVGMCRMCLVEVSGPRGMSLQPSCMQPCSEGMVVDTQSATVKKAQDGILEFLLVNHPLDCPVCDKGGECPLQDHTVTFGPGESRYVEEKRHYEKPISISDLVLLDRERCILCDRCTRFSKEVSGDPLIHFINRGNRTEVNTFPEDPYASYFSGNVVQICPVGALTSSSYRFKARPWDLDQVETTCTACSVGCRVTVQSSGDRVTRMQGVDSDPVNWGWLCDKGRWSVEAVDASARVTKPLVRKERGGAAVETSWSDAVAGVADRLRAYEPSQIGFIGGARLTNEDQYAFAKLAKGVLRTDNVDAQLGDGLPADAWLGLPSATIDDLASASLVITIAPDVKEEAPVLFLRLRDAAVNRRVPVVELSPRGTGITRYAAASLQHRPGELGVALAALLEAADGSHPAERQVAGIEADDLNAAAKVVTAAATSGRGNGRVVVLLGRPSLADDAAPVVAAAATLLGAFPDAAFLPVHHRANLRGALDMGLAPGLLPGRVARVDASSWFSSSWPGVPSADGLDTAGMLAAAAEGRLKALVLLGADPLSDFADRRLAERALSAVELLVAVDSLPNASTARADVVLPAAAATEKDGTTTNLEGRVTTVRAKVSAPGTARPDWMIAVELGLALGTDLGFSTTADVTTEIAALAPSHLGCTPAVLAARANADGVRLPLPVPAPEATDDATEEGGEPAAPAPSAPRAVAFGAPSTTPAPPQPDSYSLRLVTARVLYDQGTIVQACASLAGLAAGPTVRMHSGELERHGLKSGQSVKVLSQTGEVVLAAQADDSVPRGVAWMPFNQGGAGATDLIDIAGLRADGITKVRLESVGA